MLFFNVKNCCPAFRVKCPAKLKALFRFYDFFIWQPLVQQHKILRLFIFNIRIKIMYYINVNSSKVMNAWERVKCVLSFNSTVWHLSICLSLWAMSHDNIWTYQPIFVKPGTPIHSFTLRLIPKKRGGGMQEW